MVVLSGRSCVPVMFPAGIDTHEDACEKAQKDTKRSNFYKRCGDDEVGIRTQFNSVLSCALSAFSRLSE
jgi:hypothetical protein